MGSQRKIFGIIMSLSAVGLLYAKKFDFIDAQFDDFINRMCINNQEKDEFKIYYSSLTKKIEETDEEKRRATFRYLYDLALANLKEKHVLWYNDINPLVSEPKFVLDERFDDMRKIIRFFLTRYGAYEEYLQCKKEMNAKQNALVDQSHTRGIWQSFKSMIHTVKSTVCSWFGFASQSNLT